MALTETERTRGQAARSHVDGIQGALPGTSYKIVNDVIHQNSDHQ